ncbi:hypothetical protein ANN_27563 [Periplaneta americana]|uniref:Uncharacterized protein n=1 Tax=Periplaneta americana TaxID=6978 RepID=A0ABQ8RW31_PERAM|nr:hypothetical protein ANN_27563 [Periplaneta americana]
MPRMITDFVKYFKATYIGIITAGGSRPPTEARCAPHMWNQFEAARSSEPHTINTKAWHNRFQNIACKKRPTVYKLIRYLKDEQSDVGRMIQDLDLGRSTALNQLRVRLTQMKNLHWDLLRFDLDEVDRKILTQTLQWAIIQVVMDVIKMEPGSDPMGIQTSGIADIEEKKPLSEEGILLDLDVTKVKTECIDHRYDMKSEIVFQESAVPFDFPMLKSEAEEELCELDQVKEVKLEGTAEENEVSTERRRRIGILLEASKEIGVEVNPEKTNYMIMSRNENNVRNENIKIGNLSFEEEEKLQYLGATVTNINDTCEINKHRINMGNACYISVVKLLSSSLLSKNLKVKIYKTVILMVVLYGCETWTLSLREEHRLSLFENKMLRKIFGTKRDEVTGEWMHCILYLT